MPTPQVIFGAGSVHVKQLTDALGNKMTPAQTIPVPAVQNISFDYLKADVKVMHSQKEFPIHVAQGKKTIEISFECGEIYANLLNVLAFGQTVTAGSHAIYRDTTGTVIPDYYKTAIKIGNKKTFNLGKVLSNTSVTINGVAATAVTTLTVLSGKFKYTSGIYTFSADDVGKVAVVTYTCLGGATVVSTFKIPKGLIFNTFLYQKTLDLQKTGASGYFTLVPYSATATPPNLGEYQRATNGVFVFNSAETSSVTISHQTHGVIVSSVIATLPAAGYFTIIDPPSSTVFVQDRGVTLGTDSGTPMTGVAPGQSLTVGATPTSGQYSVTNGLYTFAAADAGDIVYANYSTDYEYVVVVPPNGGEFVENMGVRDSNGMPFTRVELTTPVSLVKGQYAVSESGAYYFDFTNNGDTVYIDYEYSVSTGATLSINNNEMGSTQTVSLSISGRAEGQEWLFKFPSAVPKSVGAGTKLDDYSMSKFVFEVQADRVTNVAGTVYMSA